MNGIEQVNKLLQGLLNLQAARNKVLYENSAGWSSGSITVPDADKYSEFDVYLWTSNNPIRCKLVGNEIRGGGLIQGVSGGLHTSAIVRIGMSGTALALTMSTVIHHATSSTHGEITSIPVQKIVGIEPIPAKILSGGALLKRVFGLLRSPVRGCAV